MGSRRKRLSLGLALVAVLAAVGGFVWRPAASGAPGSLGGPELGRTQSVEYDDVGDPSILTVTSGPSSPEYVLFWTTDWRSNVPTAVSTDLTHWKRVADSLPVLPSWAVPSRTMTWGPSAQAVPGGYVLYFSTQDASNKLECIGAGFSTSPTGPYADDSSRPLVCQPELGGSIDPSVVAEPGGTTALVWKSDGNAVHSSSYIWEQQLTADGLAVTGSPIRLLGADQPWEDGIVEGPAMLADSHGGWWLFFTGGAWQSDTYDTGVAWCQTVSGPCRVPSSKPYLTAKPGAVSPEGFDTFYTFDHQLWASYSVFPFAPSNARQALAEDRILEIAPVLSR